METNMNIEADLDKNNGLSWTERLSIKHRIVNYLLVTVSLLGLNILILLLMEIGGIDFLKTLGKSNIEIFTMVAVLTPAITFCITIVGIMIECMISMTKIIIALGRNSNGL